jgi:hypothetical protein
MLLYSLQLQLGTLADLTSSLQQMSIEQVLKFEDSLSKCIILKI